MEEWRKEEVKEGEAKGKEKKELKRAGSLLFCSPPSLLPPPAPLLSPASLLFPSLLLKGLYTYWKLIGFMKRHHVLLKVGDGLFFLKIIFEHILYSVALSKAPQNKIQGDHCTFILPGTLHTWLASLGCQHAGCQSLGSRYSALTAVRAACGLETRKTNAANELET